MRVYAAKGHSYNISGESFCVGQSVISKMHAWERREVGLEANEGEACPWSNVGHVGICSFFFWGQNPCLPLATSSISVHKEALILILVLSLVVW